MSFSTELRGWGTAIKKLVQSEYKKRPYFFWFTLIVAFLYALTRVMIR